MDSCRLRPLLTLLAINITGEVAEVGRLWPTKNFQFRPNFSPYSYPTVPFDFIRSAITSFDITHTPFKIMSVRLYVGNLSFDATADDLREIFGQTGEVVDSLIVTRPGGGRPRGFGFVTMADEAAGEEAIRQLDGQEVAGRALVVNVAKERQDADS